MVELLFTAYALVLLGVSRRMYGTHLTPFAVLTVIYIALILLNNLVFVHLGFNSVNSLSLLYLGFFLGLIFLVGQIILLCSHKVTKGDSYKLAKDYYHRVIEARWKVIFTLFTVGLVAKLYSLFIAISTYGILDTKGTSEGILAHIGNIGMMLTPLVFVYYMNHKKQLHLLVMIIAMFSSLVVFGGKYPVMILFLYTAFLYLMLNKTKAKTIIKIAGLGAFLSVAMFIAIYTIKPLIDYGEFNDRLFEDGLNFTFQHLFFYVAGSLVAMNDFFTTSHGSIESGLTILFTVPINIATALIGDGTYISPVISMRIEVVSGSWANVGGLISETVYHIGPIAAACYLTGLFSFFYLVFIQARFSGRMLSLAACLLSVAALSFFCNFMTVSGVVIPIFFLMILELLLDSNLLRRKLERSHE